MDEGPSVSPPVQARARYRAAPWLLFAIALCRAPGARAEENTATAPAAAAAPIPKEPALPTDADVPGADLFREAEALYMSGDIVGALALMEEAYASSGRPELLFNLGQLHRELGHCSEARDSYEHYLAFARTEGASEDTERRDEAEQNRRALERRCPAPPATVTAGATPHVVEPQGPQPERPYWTTARVAGWSAIGGSVVLAGTATYFAFHAHHLQNELEGDIHDAKSTGGTYGVTDEGVESSGEHAAAVARGLALGALGLAAAGVSLVVFNPGGRGPEMNAVSIRCNAGGATAVYQGTF